MNKTIFLEKNKTYNSTQNINLILSPEFYWVRIFDIPIESKKEALLALPNLFEDFIDITDFKFHIKKLDDNKYMGFAYDEELIKDSIKASGLSLRKVNSIYFAQNEFTSLLENQLDTNEVFQIEQSQYMYKDNILVQIPQAFYSEDVVQKDIEHITLSKEYIVLDNFSKFISNKQAYLLSAILVLLSVMVFAKTIMIEEMVLDNEVKIETIKIESNLPPTLFQTKSIVESLQGAQTKYKNIRTIISHGVNFKSGFKGVMTNIDFVNKSITFSYKNVKASQVKRYFTKLKKKIKYSGNDNNYKVEVSL